MARARSQKSKSKKEDLLEEQIPKEELDEEALEFIKAIDNFRRENGKPFPTWTEVLQILHSLGYRKEGN